jgi:oligosaccharyl transferase (archaeosortase A-associated)
MDKYKFSPKLLIALLIAVFFGISLIFRIALPWDKVFVGDWIKFTSIDAYYHMRLVDTLAYNFPNLTHFDPFFIYPDGINVSGLHFFDWLISGIIWVIGLGSPTQHTVNVVGVYFPAILAALVIIPVYFIGKALFNRWAGVLAAALVALLPGEFMGRSLLGFTDHHVAEVLFSTTAVLFLILAIKETGRRQLTFNHFIQRDWKTIVRPLVYSLLAGIFLGIYLIIWQGALLFVFIIALYLVIQFIIDHLRRQSTDHLGIVSFIVFLVAMIIFLPISPVRYLSAAVVIAVLIPLVLVGVSRLISAVKLKPVFYPLALIVIGVAFFFIFSALEPRTFELMMYQFSMFTPAGATAATTLEMQPFLSPQGSFSTLVAWGNFTTSFFLFRDWPIPGFALISFVILIWLFIKQRGDEKHRLLFLIWTLVILVATLVQRRFAYYFVVNVALLSAYISWQIIWLASESWPPSRRKSQKRSLTMWKPLKSVTTTKYSAWPEVLPIKR